MTTAKQAKRTPRTIEEVRAHAAAWMAKQDPTRNLPMTESCHGEMKCDCGDLVAHQDYLDACNAHEELVAALRELLDWCAGGDIPNDLYDAGRAALKRAEE